MPYLIHVNVASPKMLGWERLSLFLFFLLLINSVSALTITQTQGPSNASIINNESAQFSWNITNINSKINNLAISYNSSLEELISLYDPYILFYFNYNNVSSNEDNSTFIKDITNKANISFSPTYVNYNEGKYGLGLNFTGDSNAKARVNMTLTYGFDNFTFMTWVKLTTNNSAPQTIFGQDSLSGKYRYLILESHPKYLHFVDTSNSSYKSEGCFSNIKIPDREWHHIALVFVFNKTNQGGYKFYIDGKDCNETINYPYWETYSQYFNNSMITYIGARSYYANYTLDETIMFNKTLSDKEILTFYKSSLQKLDSNNYSLYYNTPISTMQNQYIKIYVNDSSGDNFYATMFYNNFLKNIYVYYNNVKHTVSRYFYGVNNHGGYLTPGTTVDANNDGTPETSSNLTWHLNAWDDSNMNYQRNDMSLGSYYSGSYNLDFEEWTSNITNITSTRTISARGYSISSYAGGAGYARLSNDSYSGKYSLFITSNNSSGHLYMAYTTLTPGSGNLPLDANYTVSYWVKVNGSVTMKIRPTSTLIDCNSTSVTSTGTTWTNVNLTCKFGNDGWQIILLDAINNNDTILIDDIKFYINGDYQKNLWWRSSVPDRWKNNTIRAYNNNEKILWIIDYMPAFLANISSPCDWTDDPGSCTSLNDTLFAQITLDMLDYITVNGTYKDAVDLEFWNEPYGGFWLDTLNWDNQLKVIEYNKIYNTTYKIVKSKYPSIPFGGPSGFYGAVNMTRGFLSNNSHQMDFYSMHHYGYLTWNNSFCLYHAQYYNQYGNPCVYDFVNSTMTELLNQCKLYNANCTRIIDSEWNVQTAAIANQSNQNRFNEWGASTAVRYVEFLNGFGNITDGTLYQWSSAYHYTKPGGYEDSGILYAMVSEPVLDNEYYPPYNITKTFATYHPSGSNVMLSNSEFAAIKLIATKIGNYRYFTIINTNNNQVNVTINTDDSEVGQSVTYVVRADTRQRINGVTGQVNLGVIQPYEVLTYGYAFNTQDQILNEQCNSILSGMGKFGDYIPLAIIVIVAGVLIMMFKGEDVDLGLGALTIFLALLSVAIGGTIISKMNGAC